MSSWVHRKMTGAVSGGLRLLWGGSGEVPDQQQQQQQQVKDSTQWYHTIASPE